MDSKKEEVLEYLNLNVFQPILDSTFASDELKRGIRYTMMRLQERDAIGIIHYYWSAVSGTDRSIKFAGQMKKEGFIRFEELLEEFREKFNDKWLRI